MTIQAIDIHEFKGGKIVHTWHSEDWMTGLRQLAEPKLANVLEIGDFAKSTPVA